LTTKLLAGRGGPGRGGGRKLESGAKAIPKTVTMDPADIDVLVALGDGELSRGIRRATQLVREKQQRAEKDAEKALAL
jgi:hypothetical protein